MQIHRYNVWKWKRFSIFCLARDSSFREMIEFVVVQLIQNYIYPPLTLSLRSFLFLMINIFKHALLKLEKGELQSFIDNTAKNEIQVLLSHLKFEISLSNFLLMGLSYKVMLATYSFATCGPYWCSSLFFQRFCGITILLIKLGFFKFNLGRFHGVFI